jgi:exosortase/archaeosortase family protein
MGWVKHFSLIYLFKLVCLTLILHYLSDRYDGIVSPEGSYYSQFLDQNLNYIRWVRDILMYVSNFIANGFGTESYISGPQMMKIGQGIQVEIWAPCLGFGIMSFWTAFILTNTGNWKKKSLWWLGGISSICLINCLRIALFLIALDRNWAQNSSLDHHDLFNIAAYILIGILMYSYTEDKNSPSTLENLIQPAN